MKTWPFAVVGVIALVISGCRTDPSIALLERQNRLLEDENYRLRGMLGDSETGGSPVNITTTDEADDGAAVKTQPSTSASGDKLLPRRKSSTRQTIAPPTVELPGEALPSGDVPDTLKRPAGIKLPGSEPGKIEVPEVPKHIEGPSGPALPGAQEPGKNRSGRIFKIRPTSGYEPVAKDDSKNVGQLVLNRALTGGYNETGKSGDSGILVVLEPRDAKGRRLEAPGDVAVLILDPDKTGKEAKLARWDFPADATANLFRGTGISRGMYIECPWPDKAPENNRLHLYVRYTTRDGRKLETDQYIEVALPGEKSARWSPTQTELQPTAATESIAPKNQSEEAVSTASKTNSAKLQRPVWSPERY